MEKTRIPAKSKNRVYDMQVRSLPALSKASSNRECRQRKVKCDEQRPRCKRCVSAGRTCSGYSSSASPSPASKVDQGMNVWLSSNEQKRSFDFFLKRAGSRLGGHFNTPFWSREVLQAALDYPSICHLIVALGASYELYECNNSDRQQSQFCLQECNRSITKLASSKFQSAEDLYCIITASILFATFASLQGHVAQSITHIRSGIKVLRSLDTQGISSNFPIPLARLRLYLTNLNAQVRTMIVDETSIKWEGDDLLVSYIGPVSYFLSLSEAHDYVEALYNNTLSFLQMREGHQEHNAIHDMLTRALKSSGTVLDRFVECTNNEIDKKAIAILRLHQILLSIRLGISVFGEENRESSFDYVEESLIQMLEHCRMILQSDDNEASPKPVFHSGLGVVMPLHTIAARCRNPAIRKEAVALLLKAKRREGLWDSALVERIVSTTIKLEEKGFTGRPSQVVADIHRVREVQIHFQGERSARVVFVTVQQWRDKITGHQRYIEW